MDNVPNILFLTTFLVPREEDDLPKLSLAEWELLLGENIKTATQNLEKAGFIVRGGLAYHLEIKFTVEELKKMLRERDLSLTGKKEELILRLINSDYVGMWGAVSDLKLFQCSEKGIKAIEQGIRNTTPDMFKEHKIKESKLLDIIKWVLSAITAGVIGNATYDVLKELLQNVTEALPTEVIAPTPTETASPTPTPTPKPNTPLPVLAPELVCIPQGNYPIGKGIFSHTEKAPEYWIGKYPITNMEFSEFVKDSGYITDAEKEGNSQGPIDYGAFLITKVKQDWQSLSFHGASASEALNHPVVHVSMNDAKEYCKWLSNKTNKRFRLPTAREWEISARGTNGHLFPWGDQFESFYCNTNDRKIKKADFSLPFYYITNDGKLAQNLSRNNLDILPQSTSRVGFLKQFDKSWCGASDLIGNVWEWCEPTYELLLSTKPEASDAILKGGAWSSCYNKELRKSLILISESGQFALMSATMQAPDGKLTTELIEETLDRSIYIFQYDYDLDATGLYWETSTATSGNIGFRVLQEQ
jgi:formylglycine-generating enzyme required for sulfatase activity